MNDSCTNNQFNESYIDVYETVYKTETSRCQGEAIWQAAVLRYEPATTKVDEAPMSQCHTRDLSPDRKNTQVLTGVLVVALYALQLQRRCKFSISDRIFCYLARAIKPDVCVGHQITLNSRRLVESLRNNSKEAAVKFFVIDFTKYSQQLSHIMLSNILRSIFFAGQL